MTSVFIVGDVEGPMFDRSKDMTWEWNAHPSISSYFFTHRSLVPSMPKSFLGHQPVFSQLFHKVVAGNDIYIYIHICSVNYVRNSIITLSVEDGIYHTFVVMLGMVFFVGFTTWKVFLYDVCDMFPCRWWPRVLCCSKDKDLREHHS